MTWGRSQRSGIQAPSKRPRNAVEMNAPKPPWQEHFCRQHVRKVVSKDGPNELTNVIALPIAFDSKEAPSPEFKLASSPCWLRGSSSAPTSNSSGSPNGPAMPLLHEGAQVDLERRFFNQSIIDQSVSPSKVCQSTKLQSIYAQGCMHAHGCRRLLAAEMACRSRANR